MPSASSHKFSAHRPHLHIGGSEQRGTWLESAAAGHLWLPPPCHHACMRAHHPAVQVCGVYSRAPQLAYCLSTIGSVLPTVTRGLLNSTLAATSPGRRSALQRTSEKWGAHAPDRLAGGNGTGHAAAAAAETGARMAERPSAAVTTGGATTAQRGWTGITQSETGAQSTAGAEHGRRLRCWRWSSPAAAALACLRSCPSTDPAFWLALPCRVPDVQA